LRHSCSAQVAVLAAAVVLAACDHAPAEVPPDRVAVEIAPLSLDGIGDARWRLTVDNGSDQQVWTREVTADSHGDGAGSASYVGPCDADDNDNTVTVELLELLDDGGASVAPSTYINPGPLSRDFTCRPNADVAVSFDVTVARAAQQGFFDVAVSFDDIFCSAKLDCVGADSQPLRLLHDANGVRQPTVVMALACTADVDAEATELYLDPIDISCTGRSAVVDPSAGPGRLETDAGITQSAATPVLFAAQVTRGAEGLAGKRYWNTMLGLDPAAASCWLDTTATAYSGTLPGGQTPTGSTWPYIDWHVQLTDTGGAITCTHHAVDGTPGGVATTYADPDDPEVFDYVFNGAATCSAVFGCGAPPPPELATDGLIVHLDAGDSASYPGTGTQWTDLSGSGNHATLYGNPTYSADAGGSLVFDGSGDHARLGNVSYDRGAFSVFAWHRMPAQHTAWNGVVVSKWYTGAGTVRNEFSLSLHGMEGPVPYGAVLQTNTGDFHAVGTVSPTVGLWYNVGFVYDGSALTLYENGLPVTTVAVTGTVQTTIQGMAVASFNDFATYFTRNDVGVVLMYDRALSDAEVLENFQADQARFGL